MKNLLMLTCLILLLLIASDPCYTQTPKPKARINHTAIFVKDLKATKSFYENVIGLDTIPEPFHDGKHTWYRIGDGVSMHVIEGASEKKQYYKNQHTCFSVSSVEAFTAVLRENNITWEDVAGKKNSTTTRVDGVKQIWLQDPDGYWIEINDAKE
jgi:lactoylglutathione lyase